MVIFHSYVKLPEGKSLIWGMSLWQIQGGWVHMENQSRAALAEGSMWVWLEFTCLVLCFAPRFLWCPWRKEHQYGSLKYSIFEPSPCEYGFNGYLHLKMNIFTGLLQATLGKL
jgi:hypothetical protein